jgi:hypothetical protein
MYTQSCNCVCLLQVRQAASAPETIQHPTATILLHTGSRLIYSNGSMVLDYVTEDLSVYLFRAILSKPCHRFFARPRLLSGLQLPRPGCLSQQPDHYTSISYDKGYGLKVSGVSIHTVLYVPLALFDFSNPDDAADAIYGCS